MTNKEDILGWLEEAKTAGATHLLVVSDTFEYEDYPVKVMPSEKVRDVHAKYNGKDMQRVMEVYALHIDFQKQLDEYRSFHFEYPEDGPQEGIGSVLSAARLLTQIESQFQHLSKDTIVMVIAEEVAAAIKFETKPDEVYQRITARLGNVKE